MNESEDKRVKRIWLNACEHCWAGISTQPRWGCQHYDDRCDGAEYVPASIADELAEWAQERYDDEASHPFKPGTEGAIRARAHADAFREVLDRLARYPSPDTHKVPDSASEEREPSLAKLDAAVAYAEQCKREAEEARAEKDRWVETADADQQARARAEAALSDVREAAEEVAQALTTPRVGWLTAVLRGADPASIAELQLKMVDLGDLLRAALSTPERDDDPPSS